MILYICLMSNFVWVCELFRRVLDFLGLVWYLAGQTHKTSEVSIRFMRRFKRGLKQYKNKQIKGLFSIKIAIENQ